MHKSLEDLLAFSRRFIVRDARSVGVAMGGDRAQRMALAFVNPSRAHAVAKKTGETVKKACRCNRKGPNEQFRLGLQWNGGRQELLFVSLSV